MQAGRLRQRVRIEKNVPVQDSYGEPIAGWSAVVTVWAEVRMTGGRERFVPGADQEVAAVSHRVKMRVREDVVLSPKTHRLVFGTRVLDIEAVVDPDGRGREVLCYCSERVGDVA